jgi:hypothetical protein
MNTYLISYDLGGPENRSGYVQLVSHIKDTYPNWAKPLQSVWLIKTSESTATVRDKIMAALDQND